MNTPSKVTVGLGTYAGLGTAFTAFVGGIVSIFVDGDHSQETITAFAMGTVTLVTTLIGRFAQAKEQIKASAIIATSSGSDVVAVEEPLEDVERGIGGADEPYDDPHDFDPAHEERDIHDATGI